MRLVSRYANEILDLLCSASDAVFQTLRLLSSSLYTPHFMDSLVTAVS